MKLTILFAWIGFLTCLSAESKFAVVRISDIYNSLPSTEALMKNMQTQERAISKDLRVENLKAALEELKVIQDEILALKGELQTEPAKKLIKEFKIKSQQTESMKKEFQKYQKEETKRIRGEIAIARKESIKKIVAAAEQIAKDQNFHGLLDKSAGSNSRLPVLIYARDTKDITDDVYLFLVEKPTSEKTPEESTPKTTIPK
jgi:outer membrane protein